MNGANQIHLTIDHLQQIVDMAKETHASYGVDTVPIVRITKTAFRQCHDTEDKVGCELLTSCTIPENVEE